MNKQIMNRRISKDKKINPIFFVFCEGDSEKKYVEFLSRIYRLRIITVAMDGKIIDEKEIDSYKRDYTKDKKDRTFLMYDLDVEGNLEKLKRIKNVCLLLCNPCFELWYLLHYQEQIAELDAKKCNDKLSKHLPNYQKGKIDSHLKLKITDNKDIAGNRAKKLVEHKNPSTDIYRFIEELESVKKR